MSIAGRIADRTARGRSPLPNQAMRDDEKSRQWECDGNRESPTFSPSVNCEKHCGWHGFPPSCSPESWTPHAPSGGGFRLSSRRRCLADTLEGSTVRVLRSQPTRLLSAHLESAPMRRTSSAQSSAACVGRFPDRYGSTPCDRNDPSCGLP